MWNFLVPAGMAALGAMRGNAKREQEERFNRGQAEMEKYSYATGRHGEIRPVQSSAFDGALQGGMTGLQLTQAFGGFDKAAPVEGAVGPSKIGMIANENEGLFNAGRYGEMSGMTDASNRSWNLMNRPVRGITG